ncbi:hypothetical protein TELCIR_00943 [Teladorsagia circumcincta]|uniref:Uncharacterized protein n=1 Tax=Teladorsagia circumcincta TaxID=45464 RepID=A0A2G9V4Q4_TELCI|nr:hypothetical protein TELCIR_00943 [Teladorsagia circumcincta]
MPPPAWYSQSTYSLNIIPEEHIPPADYDDVVHKEVGEALDRHGKPLAASAYNLNLTPPLTSVDDRHRPKHYWHSAASGIVLQNGPFGRLILVLYVYKAAVAGYRSDGPMALMPTIEPVLGRSAQVK